jgi:hypothetical protein
MLTGHFCRVTSRRLPTPSDKIEVQINPSSHDRIAPHLFVDALIGLIHKLCQRTLKLPPIAQDRLRVERSLEA